MTRQGFDKRRHHRSLASLSVRVQSGRGIPPGLQIVSIDIGVGGVRCAANQPVEPKTQLQMHFTLVGGDLPQPQSITADGIVLRCTENPAAPEPRRYEVAVQFLRIEPQARQKLQSYLNSL
jgi:c-di-GMP-binding flagellar brake protein YcgR